MPSQKKYLSLLIVTLTLFISTTPTTFKDDLCSGSSFDDCLTLIQNTLIDCTTELNETLFASSVHGPQEILETYKAKYEFIEDPFKITLRYILIKHGSEVNDFSKGSPAHDLFTLVGTGNNLGSYKKADGSTYTIHRDSVCQSIASAAIAGLLINDIQGNKRAIDVAGVMLGVLMSDLAAHNPYIALKDMNVSRNNQILENLKLLEEEMIATAKNEKPFRVFYTFPSIRQHLENNLSNNVPNTNLQVKTLFGKLIFEQALGGAMHPSYINPFEFAIEQALNHELPYVVNSLIARTNINQTNASENLFWKGEKKIGAGIGELSRLLLPVTALIADSNSNKRFDSVQRTIPIINRILVEWLVNQTEGEEKFCRPLNTYLNALYYKDNSSEMLQAFINPFLQSSVTYKGGIFKESLISLKNEIFKEDLKQNVYGKSIAYKTFLKMNQEKVIEFLDSEDVVTKPISAIESLTIVQEKMSLILGSWNNYIQIVNYDTEFNSVYEKIREARVDCENPLILI